MAAFQVGDHVKQQAGNILLKYIVAFLIWNMLILWVRVLEVGGGGSGIRESKTN